MILKLTLISLRYAIQDSTQFICLLYQSVCHSLRLVTTGNGASDCRSLQDAVESLCARMGESPDTLARKKGRVMESEKRGIIGNMTDWFLVILISVTWASIVTAMILVPFWLFIHFLERNELTWSAVSFLSLMFSVGLIMMLNARRIEKDKKEELEMAGEMYGAKSGA